MFTSEHRKMLWFLERFAGKLRRLDSRTPGLAREIIALFDDEAQFKHLVMHHDLREHNILYPTLDRVASEEERRAMLDQGAVWMNEGRGDT